MKEAMKTVPIWMTSVPCQILLLFCNSRIRTHSKKRKSKWRIIRLPNKQVMSMIRLLPREKMTNF